MPNSEALLAMLTVFSTATSTFVFTGAPKGSHGGVGGCVNSARGVLSQLPVSVDTLAKKDRWACGDHPACSIGFFSEQGKNVQERFQW